MQREYFYVKPENISESTVLFLADESAHLVNSLRKKEGDLVWAVDGHGHAYEVELSDCTGPRVRGGIIRRRKMMGEAVTRVTLAQAVIKGKRYATLVETAT